MTSNLTSLSLFLFYFLWSNGWIGGRITNILKCSTAQTCIGKGCLCCLALVVHRSETQLYILNPSIFIRYWWPVLLCTQSFELHSCSLLSSEVFTEDSALCYTVGYSLCAYQQLSSSGHNQFPVLSTTASRCTGLVSLVLVYDSRFVGAIRPFSAYKGNYCAFGWLSKSLGLQPSALSYLPRCALITI